MVIRISSNGIIEGERGISQIKEGVISSRFFFLRTLHTQGVCVYILVRVESKQYILQQSSISYCEMHCEFNICVSRKIYLETKMVRGRGRDLNEKPVATTDK